MIDCGSIEYAQARLQARHGQRADEAAWQRLETAREFVALLDAARSSPLRAWVVGLTPYSGAHEIDTVLRTHWRATVAEVAAWMPRAWQPALAWCALLPLLPALQHLARGGAVAPWMRSDTDLRELCTVAAAERLAVMAAGPMAALAPAWRAPQPFAAVWQQAWAAHLPRPLRADGDSLQAVVQTVRAHASAFAVAPAGQGRPLRRALQARLALLLRSCAVEPAAAFIHIALCALDLERLRGELILRAVFTPAMPAGGA